MTTPSPLELEIRNLIRLGGPMSVADYMSLCLTHPLHGYYVTRDPLGARGDFITAPEVSQMFGEILGVWCGAVWRAMGSPENVRLVELGPGRGTMMRDALRAVQIVPGMHAALVAHLVEVSPALERQQRRTLGTMRVPAMWHRSLDEVPAGPLIVLANEFFDALPVHQAVRDKKGWHERVVALDADGKLAFALGHSPIAHFDRALPWYVRDAPTGTVFEWRSDHHALELGRRVVTDRGAALLIDYGHWPQATGDTLQAVGGHAFADPLATPGQVDLTAHVDFQAIALAAESIGARVHGPVDQADFLYRLGIQQRAAALHRHATPEQALDVDAALKRLTGGGPGGMGRLFKVLAIADPRLGDLPGFDE